MTIFYCECCKYETIHRGSYNKHLKTKRHHRNLESFIKPPNDIITNSKSHNKNSTILIKNSKKSPDHEIKTTNITKKTEHSCRQYQCKYCNTSYVRIDNYNKHLNKCSKHLFDAKIKLEKENDDLQRKLERERAEFLKFKIELQQDKLEFMEKNRQLEKQMNDLKEENYKLKHKHEVKDTEIKYLKKVGNVTNNKINNITQYIINKYPDAPNLKPIEDFSEFEKYTTLNSNKESKTKSITKFINDHFCDGIPPTKRSIWCTDPSRDKYIIKVDNKWETDFHGLQFCKQIIHPLATQYLNYISDLMKSNIADFSTRVNTLQDFYLYISGISKLPRTVYPLLTIKDSKEEKKLNSSR